MISVLAEEKATTIRFGLQGGGCNGFSYFFMIEYEEQGEDDFEITLNEACRIFVDAASYAYLENAEVDYKKDLMGESFIFNNPNTTTKCGCGSSVGFD